VRAFVQSGSYASVPLEVQAFRLDHRYTEDPATPFLVEDEVRHWSDAGNYIISAVSDSGKQLAGLSNVK
jgi:hypothetical protein